MQGPVIDYEPLPGVFVCRTDIHIDGRGKFCKYFHRDSLREQGIDFTPVEYFSTESKLNVIRGMHFQAGTSAQQKLVSCIHGSVLDVIVDVRPNSPYFNKPFSVELSSTNNTSVFVGKGYSHGFLSLEDKSIMLYSTSTIHSPENDLGVLWSSIDFDWPVAHPVVSERDSRHPEIGFIQCEFF